MKKSPDITCVKCGISTPFVDDWEVWNDRGTTKGLCHSCILRTTANEYESATAVVCPYCLKMLDMNALFVKNEEFDLIKCSQCGRKYRTEIRTKKTAVTSYAPLQPQGDQHDS